MKPKSICAIAAFNVLFLCSSFCFDGIEGVHRWVYIGPLALNVAFILLPVLLINIYHLSQNGYLDVYKRQARIFPLRSIMPAWCACALQRMSASALHQMLRTWCPFMKTGLSAKVLYCVFRFGRRFSSGRFVVCLQTISLQKQEAAILFWHWNKMRAASICLMRAMQ